MFEEANKAGKTAHMPVIEVIESVTRKRFSWRWACASRKMRRCYIFLAFSLVYGKFAGILNSIMLTGVMLGSSDDHRDVCDASVGQTLRLHWTQARLHDRRCRSWSWRSRCSGCSTRIRHR